MAFRTCRARSRARFEYCFDSAVSWLDIWLMPAGPTRRKCTNDQPKARHACASNARQVTK